MTMIIIFHVIVHDLGVGAVCPLCLHEHDHDHHDRDRLPRHENDRDRTPNRDYVH
eukprot:UN13130